jgi:hypothetical protein
MWKNAFFALMGFLSGLYFFAVAGVELNHENWPSEEHQQQGETDKPVSNPHPPSAELPAPSAQIRTTPEQSDNHPKKADTFKRIADWTWRFFTDIKITDALLVFFTAVLAFRTADLFRETAIAAKAAKDGAEALPKLERAYLFFEITSDNIAQCLYGKHTEGLTPEVKWRIINYGRTPGTISSAGVQLVLSHERDLPFDWNAIPREVLKSDYFHPGVCRYDHILKAHERTRIIRRTSRLLFKFTVTYRDVLGEDHTTADWWQYDGDRERFIPADGGAHEKYT